MLCSNDWKTLFSLSTFITCESQLAIDKNLFLGAQFCFSHLCLFCVRITVVITVASVPRVGKQLPHVIPAFPMCSMLCAHLQGLQGLRLDKGVPQALLSVLLLVAGLTHTGRSLAQSDLAHLLSWKKQWHCQTSPHSLQFLLLGSTVKSYLVHIQIPLMSFSGS